MIGLLSTNIKIKLGPLLNGIVNHEDFVPPPTFDFPGVKEMLAKYQEGAVGQGVDPLGFGFPPFAYAAGQVLAAAVQETNSLNHEQIAGCFAAMFSRPWRATALSAKMANWLRLAWSLPNFVMLRKTTSINSAT